MATATKAKSSTKSPTVNVVISTFAGWNRKNIYKTIRNGAIKRFKPINETDYILEGGTPLLDSVAQFIGDLEKLKKKGSVVVGCLADASWSMQGNEKSVIGGINEFVAGMQDVTEVDPEADGKVLAVILTDGEENSSTEVTADQIRSLISEKEDDNWTFIYLGANQDAWTVGMGLGLSGTASGQTVNYVSNAMGTSTAMEYAGTSASCFLASNATYASSARENAKGSLNEHGNWIGK